MIQLISREEVVYKSSLVDHTISEFQKEWYNSHGHTLTGNIDKVSIHGEELYDHLDFFHDEREVLYDFAILGYVEKTELIIFRIAPKLLSAFLSLWQ